MNKHVSKLEEPVLFSDEEERLLQGPPYIDASKELRQRITLLGLEQWPEAMTRNLTTLFVQMDEGYKPSLRS